MSIRASGPEPLGRAGDFLPLGIPGSGTPRSRSAIASLVGGICVSRAGFTGVDFSGAEFSEYGREIPAGKLRVSFGPARARVVVVQVSERALRGVLVHGESKCEDTLKTMFRENCVRRAVALLQRSI